MHLFPAISHRNFVRLLLFSFPLFFILLADNVMSYVFPIVVQTSLHSNTWLGIVMALSSVCGIFCDFLFPQLLVGRSWKFQLFAGIVFAFLFPVTLQLGAFFTSVYLFILATLIWGVYYEFLQFSQQSFVVSEQKKIDYTQNWGFLFFIWQITTIVGPIIGSFLLTQTRVLSAVTVNSFQIIALLFLLILMIRLPHKVVKHESHVKKTLTLLKELIVWKTYGERIWPVILSGVLTTCVIAAFWTIGGLYGMELFGKQQKDWLFMFAFSAPMILGSFLMTRFPVHTQKKKYLQIALFFAGLSLVSLVVTHVSMWAVLLSIVSTGFCISFAAPLNESVYSDLLERSGKGKMHLLGIAKSNFSFAYIVSPLITGLLSDSIGYNNTFILLGFITCILSGFLFLTTPKKLRLPQQKLKTIIKI